MATVHLAFGSNLGDRLEHMRRALAALAPHVVIEKISSVYESEPMYRTEQPPFYNLALRGTTELTPLDLLTEVKLLERELGRQARTRNAEREIDIDILFLGNTTLESPHLTIPHPRLHERAFVLVPLHEIDPFLEHPVSRKPIIEMWDELRGGQASVWPATEQL